MSEEKIEEVKETVAPSAPQEIAPSPEVKEEVKTEEKPEEVEVNKDKEQISNLNTALKQEREERKKMAEKAQELENRVKESSETIGRLKQVFTPEEKKEIAAETQYMTKEEADDYFEQKFQEVQKKQEAEKKSEMIKTEIGTLEKEWDGLDGKPKYEDQEVLDWQKENNKLYLSPKEAFLSMRQNEIIDYSVKQRLAGKKDVQEVEKPGGGEINHQPEEKTPQTDEEVRKAVEEAISNLDKEI